MALANYDLFLDRLDSNVMEGELIENHIFGLFFNVISALAIRAAAFYQP